jgi:hypothetical protein
MSSAPKPCLYKLAVFEVLTEVVMKIYIIWDVSEQHVASTFDKVNQ